MSIHTFWRFLRLLTYTYRQKSYLKSDFYINLEFFTMFVLLLAEKQRISFISHTYALEIVRCRVHKWSVSSFLYRLNWYAVSVWIYLIRYQVFCCWYKSMGEKALNIHRASYHKLKAHFAFFFCTNSKSLAPLFMRNTLEKLAF